MTFRKIKNLTLSILAAAALGSGCITCNVEQKDKDADSATQVEEARPSSFLKPISSDKPVPLNEMLTPEESAQAEAMSQYAQAHYLRSIGKEEESRALLLKALSQYPDSDCIMKELIGPYIAAKDWKGALEFIEKVVQSHPNSHPCNLVYAELLFSEGKKKEAVGFLKKLCNDSPDEKYAFLLVKYLFNQRQFDELDALLLRLFELEEYHNSIKWLAIHIKFVTAAYRQFDAKNEESEEPDFSDDEEDEEDAEDEEEEEEEENAGEDSAKLQAESSKEENSEDVSDEETPQKAHWSKYTKEELKSCIDGLLALLLKQPITNPADLGEVGGLLAINDRWQDMLELVRRIEGQGGELVQSLPFYKMKLDALDKCGKQDELKRCMEDLVSKKQISFSLAAKLSEKYSRQKNYPMAIQMMEICLAYDRDNWGVVFRLASLLMDNGEYDKAMLLLSLRQTLPPSGSFLLGLIWKRKGDYKNAYKSMKLAENDQTFNREYYFTNMSMVCEKCGKIDEAIDYARKAYECDTDSANNCNFYGYMLADYKRELPTAKKLLLKAVAAEPENAAILDSTAWVYFRLKEYDKAMEFIFKALAHNGLEEDPEGVIADHAGDICHAKGLHDLARFYWNVALHSQNTAADKERIGKKLK